MALEDQIIKLIEQNASLAATVTHLAESVDSLRSDIKDRLNDGTARMVEIEARVDSIRTSCVHCGRAADEAEFAAQSVAERVLALESHKERTADHGADIGDLKAKIHRAEHHIARMAPYHAILSSKYGKWVIGVWMATVTLASLFTLVDHKEIVFKLVKLIP